MSLAMATSSMATLSKSKTKTKTKTKKEKEKQEKKGREGDLGGFDELTSKDAFASLEKAYSDISVSDVDYSNLSEVREQRYMRGENSPDNSNPHRRPKWE